MRRIFAGDGQEISLDFRFNTNQMHFPARLLHRGPLPSPDGRVILSISRGRAIGEMVSCLFGSLVQAFICEKQIFYEPDRPDPD